jgi:hypothetical protein
VAARAATVRNLIVFIGLVFLFCFFVGYCERPG